MVAIVRTEWNGTSGGPGLSQFAILGGTEFTAGTAQGAVNAATAFWNGIKAYLPDELRLNVSPIVDIYNEANGELTASFAAPVVPTPVLGLGTSGYAGGAGVKINWATGVVRNGRRVRGATFIVPVLATVFGNTGNPQAPATTTLTTAAATLMSAMASNGSPLLVWSRPLVEDKVIVRPGFTTGVLSGAVSNKSAILRGRRD